MVAPLSAGKADCSARDAGRDGDGDGERVVDDQRGGGHEARVGAEVGPGDGVGAAAHRIGVDDLAVGEHQDRQEGDDGDRDGEDEVQSAGARHGQHEDDGLGPVGDRGQCVEREGREALDRGDALLPGAPRRSWRPDQHVPEGCGRASFRVCHDQDFTAGAVAARRYADVRTAPVCAGGVHVRSAVAVDRPDARMIPRALRWVV